MSRRDDHDGPSCRGCEIVTALQSENRRLITALESLTEEFNSRGGSRCFTEVQRKEIISQALRRKL